MTRVFVDTNVFLRFLTNDDPAKAGQVEAMFRKTVQGESVKIVTYDRKHFNRIPWLDIIEP